MIARVDAANDRMAAAILAAAIQAVDRRPGGVVPLCSIFRGLGPISQVWNGLSVRRRSWRAAVVCSRLDLPANRGGSAGNSHLGHAAGGRPPLVRIAVLSCRRGSEFVGKDGSVSALSEAAMRTRRASDACYQIRPGGARGRKRAKCPKL